MLKLYSVGIIAMDQGYTGVELTREDAVREKRGIQERQRCYGQEGRAGKMMLIMLWS